MYSVYFTSELLDILNVVNEVGTPSFNEVDSFLLINEIQRLAGNYLGACTVCIMCIMCIVCIVCLVCVQCVYSVYSVYIECIVYLRHAS